MPKLVKVAATRDVAPGTGRVVEPEGNSLALFNVTTGAALGPLTDEGVRSFPVKVQGNDVLVELD